MFRDWIGCGLLRQRLLVIVAPSGSVPRFPLLPPLFTFAPSASCSSPTPVSTAGVAAAADEPPSAASGSG